MGGDEAGERRGSRSAVKIKKLLLSPSMTPSFYIFCSQYYVLSFLLEPELGLRALPSRDAAQGGVRRGESCRGGLEEGFEGRR